MRFIQLALLLLTLAPISHASFSDYVDQLKKNPPALYALMEAMPKGGELHYHLAGGAYPEDMLNLAISDHYCLDHQTYTLTQALGHHCQKNSSLWRADHPLKKEVIKAWSFQRFEPIQESAHDHFFASFFKFMPLVIDYRAPLLASIMKRAAHQQELYMEVMILPDNGKAARFGKSVSPQAPLKRQQQQLLAKEAFQQNIRYTREEASRILQKAHKLLNCEKKNPQPACKLTVKFQYYVLREQPLNELFAQALNGFAAASQSSDLIAINLVQAEDGPIARHDYRAQMRIIEFLHQAYPNVHIALHAGELVPSIAPLPDLHFHIHDAVMIGKAERIGHGIDIAYEKKYPHLLRLMAEKEIPVEINLTSNEKILNISKTQHPLINYYLAHHVPIVLSTDDEGILGTTLTQEYTNAITIYGLNYEMIKAANRNTLTYSFLPGKSLWENNRAFIPISACKKLQSKTCLNFLKSSEKAQLQWLLETRLQAFEDQFSKKERLTT